MQKLVKSLYRSINRTLDVYYYIHRGKNLKIRPKVLSLLTSSILTF